MKYYSGLKNAGILTLTLVVEMIRTDRDINKISTALADNKMSPQQAVRLFNVLAHYLARQVFLLEPNQEYAFANRTYDHTNYLVCTRTENELILRIDDTNEHKYMNAKHTDDKQQKMLRNKTGNYVKPAVIAIIPNDYLPDIKISQLLNDSAKKLSLDQILRAPYLTENQGLVYQALVSYFEILCLVHAKRFVEVAQSIYEFPETNGELTLALTNTRADWRGRKTNSVNNCTVKNLNVGMRYRFMGNHYQAQAKSDKDTFRRIREREKLFVDNVVEDNLIIGNIVNSTGIERKHR